MKHLVTLAAALVASTTLIGAATSAHAQTGGYYQATPAATPSKSGFVTRSTPWRLQGGSFIAAKAPERDMILCQLVAQRAGALASFSAGGKAYDAAALDQCNGKHKAAAAQVASTGGQAQ